MTSHLTTHVLDAATGFPAAGMGIVLTAVDGSEIARGITDSDGRLGLGPDELEAGDYAIVFETGPYFAAQEVETFYPEVGVTFTVSKAAHYHVPLLLSPFAYSTYRGS